MMLRFALLLLASPALVQVYAAPPPAPAQAVASPVYATARVVLDTSVGPITLELETERAPITSANFLAYVTQKRFDGATFYRATRIGEGYGLVQGGINSDPAKALKPIAHEPTSATGLSHVDGAISMARFAPGTASGDFFITIGNLPAMDANPIAPGDNQGFAVFGRVVEGMDVIRAILASPTSPTEGEGVMRGQMLSPRIAITSARRLDR